MAAAKKAVLAPYTDLAEPEDIGHEHWDGEDSEQAKAALSSDTAASTYEDTDVPHQSVQKRGKIK